MPIDLNEHLRRKNKDLNQNNENGENENLHNDRNRGEKKENGGGRNGWNRGFQTPKMPNFSMPSARKMAGFYILIILAVLFFLLKPFTIINSGEVGVKITTGEFDQTPLQPGIHFYIPGIQKIIAVNTKVRIAEFTSAETSNLRNRDEGSLKNQAISVLDSRGLSVSVELAVQYRLDPLSVPQTIATWGQNWEERIITPVIREIVRNVVGSFPAEELPTKRNEIATLIDQKFRENINGLENRPVELISIQLTEIVLPPAIKEQIERVQVARQEAERARYEVERAKQEAEKKAALAKGVADATIIEADAQAKANRLISQSLNGSLLQLRQIEVQGKFNEALQNNRDAKIFLTPGGATPNIWLDSKDNQRASSISNAQ